MNNLTKELIQFSGSNRHSDVVVDERPNRTLVQNMDGFSGSIFEFTVENFINELNIFSFKSQIQYIRRKIGKKFKDFNKKDCLDFLDVYVETYQKGFCFCPFGVGSDQQWDTKVVTIDNKEYFEYYFDY